MPDLAMTDFSRMFLIEDRAGPDNAATYQSLWRAGALSWDQGDITLVYIPDPNKYQGFKVSGKINGAPSNPQLAVDARYTLDRSELMRLLRKGKDNDVQLHFGACGNPRDFNGGWQKILVLEGARIGSYGTEDLGALQPDQVAAINENTTLIGEDAYEIKRIAFGTKAGALITVAMVDVCFYDAFSAGVCNASQTPCDVIFALQQHVAGGKGAVLFSKDAGLTWTSRTVTSLVNDADVSAVASVGSYAVVINDAGIHWCSATDMLNSAETWALVTAGLVLTAPSVTGGEPKAIFSYSQSATWIVGAAGYVYFSDSITDGVEVQDAGSATTEQLNAIHGIDDEHLVAVGNNNAVIKTTDGGTTWTAVTGPAASDNLNTVFMKDEYIWFVGTATGELWYTTDAGVSWTQKGFPGGGTGSVTSVVFSTPSVGYLAHTTTAPAGRILRTIDGGNTWYVLPEGTGSIPTNTGINALACCNEPNLVYGAGTTSGSGILVVAS